MGHSTQSFSILCVDRNLDALEFLKKSFEQEQSSLQPFLDHALDIDQALEKLKSNTYHLLVVDSEFDHDANFDFFAKVRGLKLKMPFVLMTPVRDDALARRALESGIAEVIVKNESHYEDLLKRLNQYKADTVGRSGKRQRMEEVPADADEKEPKVDPVNIKDELTGLYNHSYLYDRVVREFSQAARYTYPLSCLMIDLDHFRELNEKWGYRTGDSLLKECAQLLFKNCRLSDFIARYGGEEFVVLMPHVDYKGAQELANRIRVVFSEHKFFDHAGTTGSEINVTISIGISSYPQDPMERRGEILTNASNALTRSKTAGRNRVTLYKDILPVMGQEIPILQISEAKVLDFQRKMSEVSSVARRATIDASKALIRALEDKDRFTAGHAASCAKYSIHVAEAMGMSLDDAEVVEHAALLHDIGKICISDQILLKPGRLSFAEFEAMKQHPYLGYKILKPIRFLMQEATLVLHHHEWFNGEGYPCRLKGNEIPLGARIIAVIDSYDTMRIAGGRYKKTSTVEDTLRELINCSGTQFDPAVVKSFIEVLKARGELTTDNYDKERLEKLIQENPAPQETATPGEPAK